jgi:hypothetical protein
MAKSVHLAYASVRKEFFSNKLWNKIVEHPELYNLEPAPEELLDSDTEEDLVGFPSARTNHHPQYLTQQKQF